MKIHVVSGAEHTGAHAIAIHQHLPAELRGDVLVDRYARAPRHWHPSDIVMAPSFTDIARARGHRVIYVEHGAGQSYVDAKPGFADYYPGGRHPENVIAHIGPREDVVNRWDVPGFAAGAPICDPYELYSPERVAAITFHWTAPQGPPEAGTAFEHYAHRLFDIVQALQDEGYEVLAHHHPRFTHLHSVWTRLGMRVASVDEVRRRAQLLIADNTSLMYEMLYLYRDVIALNAPWYRRDVEHGLRFWQWQPYTHAEDADYLIDLIRNESMRRAEADGLICGYVYGKRRSDGYDGQRAAAWITMTFGS